MAKHGFLVISIASCCAIGIMVYDMPNWFSPTINQLRPDLLKHASTWMDSSERAVYFPNIYEELTAAQKSGRLELLPYTPITLDKAMNEIRMQDTIQMLAKQTQILCPNWRMYGKGPGTWPVCLAKELLPTAPCVVYSFGINYDWSFDEEYHREHFCTLRTFDPSMGKTPEHEQSPGIFFYPVGLSDKEYTTKKGWKMNTFKHYLTRFNEDNVTIPYLKFDIETYEFLTLHNMFADGVLTKVMQLSVEIHVNGPFNKKHLTMMFDAVKGLEKLGFRRWFYHQRLNGLPFQCDQSFININYLK